MDYTVLEYFTLKYNAAQNLTEQTIPIHYIKTQEPIQKSTVQKSNEQHNTVKHKVIQYSTTEYSTIYLSSVTLPIAHTVLIPVSLCISLLTGRLTLSV